MTEYKIKEIQPNAFFTKTLYLDNSFVITAPEMPLTDEIIQILEKWNFNGLFSEGEPSSQYVASKTAPAADTSTNAQTGGKSAADGKTQAQSVGKPADVKIDFSKQADSNKLEKADEFYRNFLFYVENMLVKASVSNELSYDAVTEKIKDMIEYIKEERRYLMRVIKNTESAPDKNYIATHSVRSTIIAIIIGTYLKIPNYRLVELGVAALVHEAGMLKLPSNVYLNQRPLNEHEQKAIVTHPIHGYSMLKSFDFPLPICLAALEHHERENGSGYPRRLPGDKISLYSKIIAVACSYEALSSKRPHKEAKDGHTGMLELLKNEGKRYDDTVVKALVLSFSIYPIGLYVLLSNGKKGQVVDLNPENSRYPIVQIFGEFTPDGKVKTVQTAADGLSIVRPLAHKEIET